MAYCSNCGHQLVDDAKFCSECGTPVNNVVRSERKVVFEGDVHKCPNCGEILNSFTVECPACGYELRNTGSSIGVQEFILKLEKIEASRGTRKRKFFGGNSAERTNIRKRRVSLIRSFSIPNTKEDILEFMILAASNVNTKAELSEAEAEESDAWKAKLEQAYQKAEYQFGDDEEFLQFQKIYTQKMKEIKRKRIQFGVIIIACVASPWLVAIVIMIISLLF